MDKLISIVIPSFNRQEDLVHCLERLEHQTNLDFEVVVVDDCSFRPVKIECEFNYDLVLYRSDVNLGAAGARNKGVQLARGDWILFLDDDDSFTDDKLQVVLDLISRKRDVNFIYHRALIHMINERCSYITSVTDSNCLSFERLLGGNYVGGAPVFAIKKELFLSVDGFDTTLPAIEDYEFVLRLSLLKSVNVCFLDAVLTECRYITKRASVSKNFDALETAITILNKRFVNFENQDVFSVNCHLMRAHCLLMNLDRRCSLYYVKAFCSTTNFKYILAGTISLLSPKALIFIRSRIG
ncbi:glycosyltransferase family 2 protein [Shewanella sp. JM162201]|uniref:Glycosyltransferase family 2 protein n=1 Tax=Shewanella jiangmenensis TaxID=2837387 RepID=A0ABS5V090_9GAMM|nr:glycosyltransferase family A protein [Shewanella jiangmenensis]MBT1442999.1 glycosyltransferase family 2 protein [Shewanella jiangmenensis]